MAIDGDWNLTINTPMGQQTATLSVKTEGGKLTGTMSAMAGAQNIENGTVDGDNVGWTTDIVVPMPMTLAFKGVVSGDAIDGSVTLGAFGESTFSGSRA